MAGYLETICGVAAVAYLLYRFFTSSFDFWEKRGVKGPKPVPVVGNITEVLLLKSSLGDFMKKIYDQYPDEPMIGVFARRKPVLILKDPDLIKDVLIKDFSNFAARALPRPERAEPLTANLLTLEPKRWRPLRLKFSPVFTSGKLKDMFAMILECADRLEIYLEKVAARGEPVEIRDLTAKYTTDVIGSCAFGLEMNALADDHSEFRKMGKGIFEPEGFDKLRRRFRELFPSFYNTLGFILPYPKITEFFVSIIMNTIKYRRENNVDRNDFVNVLMQLQDHPEKLGDIELSDHLLAAQAVVFFAAGFETSSTTISNALYELALHQDIQDKLREEIKQTLKENKDDLQYETIKHMKYLDKIFRETLRKYPPGTFLARETSTNYTFEGTKISIPEKQIVWIPVYAIHHDSKIYPEPEKFDIERFSEEAVAARHSMHYLPFGDGPRNCIGARFAVYQTKIGLIKFLHRYKIDVCKDTPIPYENDPTSLLLRPKGGIHLVINRIRSS